MTSIKSLAVLLLAFPALLNAQGTQTINLPAGNGYFISVTCEKTNNNDSEIILRLGGNTSGKDSIMILTGPENGCDAISQDDFDGDGILDVSIAYGNQSTSSQRIYLLDIDRKLIIDSGAIPVPSSRLNDGSYLYDELSYGSKFRSIYIFSKKKVVEKKTTQLVFDGKVCLNSDGEIKRYSDCPNGTVATQNDPICFEREHQKSFKLVPLENCSIDKSEVFGLHE